MDDPREFTEAVKRVREVTIEANMSLSLMNLDGTAVAVMHVEHPRHGPLAFHMSPGTLQNFLTGIINILRQNNEQQAGQLAPVLKQ